MKNITLSAQDHLLAEARKKAANNGTTLNSLFREWLIQYTTDQQRDQAVENFYRLMNKTSYVRVGRKFTREEMNER
jgi:hypothetical protein